MGAKINGGFAVCESELCPACAKLPVLRDIEAKKLLLVFLLYLYQQQVWEGECRCAFPSYFCDLLRVVNLDYME